MSALERCAVPRCIGHVEGRGLCLPHWLWRRSLGAGVVALRPVPTAEEIRRALARWGLELRPTAR